MLYHIFYSVDHLDKREPFLHELVLGLFARYGVLPIRKRVSCSPTEEARFNRFKHWIVSTELDSKGTPKRRNKTVPQCSTRARRTTRRSSAARRAMFPCITTA